jgi:hypothetical protein
VAHCAPELALQAESLLHLIGELESCGPALADGARIPLGWAQLSVRAHGEDLVLCEPRFAGDPFVEVDEDITQTLAILVEQSALAQRLGVALEPIAFDATVFVACDALAEQRIYAERRSEGWYIAPIVDREELECEPLRVFELIARRPSLRSVLALPTGFLVSFEGDAIDTVLDDRDDRLA